MTNSIPIKHKEAIYILNYKNKHLFEKYFCTWRVELTSVNAGTITCYVKWFYYFLFFIPLHLLALIGCCWNGGLSSFSILPRRIHNFNYSGAQMIGSKLTQFGKLKSIYEYHKRPLL